MVPTTPEQIPRMENWGSMTDSWEIQLEEKTSLMGLARKKNLRAIRMMRPRRVMASKKTSRRKRRQLRNKRLPRSPQALLARGHSVLT
jgi:hypothetical protein